MFIGIDYSIVGSSCHIWTFNKHADGKHKRIIYIYIAKRKKIIFSLQNMYKNKNKTRGQNAVDICI